MIQDQVSQTGKALCKQIVLDQTAPVKEEQSDQGFCLVSSANNLLLTWMDLHK